VTSLYTLTLHGTRGDRERTPILFATHYEALQYLHEINSKRRVSGLGPATASLTRNPHRPTLFGLG